MTYYLFKQNVPWGMLKPVLGAINKIQVLSDEVRINGLCPKLVVRQAGSEMFEVFWISESESVDGIPITSFYSIKKREANPSDFDIWRPFYDSRFEDYKVFYGDRVEVTKDNTPF